MSEGDLMTDKYDLDTVDAAAKEGALELLEPEWIVDIVADLRRFSHFAMMVSMTGCADPTITRTVGQIQVMEHCGLCLSCRADRVLCGGPV